MTIIIDNHIPHIQGLIEPYAEVLYLEPGDITREVVREADALVVRTRTRCNADLLDGSRVRFIGSATIGTDHIDLDYCAQHGITVRNAPGCNAPAVAQWVFCAINAWMRHRGIATPSGLTLGIVGVGHVGSIVARWAQQLGYRIMLNDPPLAEDGTAPLPLHMPHCSLRDLQRECDIITFHTPLTSDGKHPTWHLCNESFVQGLERCKLIVNAAQPGFTRQGLCRHPTHRWLQPPGQNARHINGD